MQQPRQPVMVLSTNTKRDTGRKAQISNINAARNVASIIRTTLGPRSMLKMILDPMAGRERLHSKRVEKIWNYTRNGCRRCEFTLETSVVLGVVLTNDGHAILREIDVTHPAAKTMLEISRAQDEEVKTTLEASGEDENKMVLLFVPSRLTNGCCFLTSLKCFFIYIFHTRFECILMFLHSFRVYFKVSPLVSSVCYVFSTRFECVLWFLHSFRVYFKVSPLVSSVF